MQSATQSQGTSASALIGCGGKKRTRLVPLLSATATHTDIDSDMTVSKYIALDLHEKCEAGNTNAYRT